MYSLEERLLAVKTYYEMPFFVPLDSKSWAGGTVSPARQL